MRRVKRANRLSIAVAFVLFSALAAGLLLSRPASAAATLAVGPSTGLTAGESVTVTGAGFDESSTGGVLECNNDASQPTVSVLGNDIPVSCTNPLSNVASTDASGNLSTTFTIESGVTGPPGPGTDTSGGDAATDAADYPCPPTPAQMSAGVSCVISYGDEAGAKATIPISFAVGGTTTATTSLPSSTTTTTQPTTTTTIALPGFLTVVAGQPTMIQGAGFGSSEQVTAAIHSTPIQLGAFTASSLGIASGSVTIPLDTVVGYHQILLTGVSTGHVDTIPAWIIQAQPGPPVATSATTTGAATTGAATTGVATTGVATDSSSTPGSPSPGTSSLAYTGAGHGVWITLASGLLLLDLGYLIVSPFCRPRQLLLRRGCPTGNSLRAAPPRRKAHEKSSDDLL